LVRSVTAALTALHRYGAPLSGCKPPQLALWEEPVSDPDLTVWYPEGLATWREDQVRRRSCAKARQGSAMAGDEADAADEDNCEKRERWYRREVSSDAGGECGGEQSSASANHRPAVSFIWRERRQNQQGN